MRPTTLAHDEYPREEIPPAPLKRWRDIAEEMELPEGTVYQIGMAALRKLRRALQGAPP